MNKRIKIVLSVSIPGLPRIYVEDNGRGFKRRGCIARYSTWYGGGGIGNHHTLRQARGHVHSYASIRLSQMIKSAKETLYLLENSRAKLGHETRHLRRFTKRGV